MPCYEYEDTRTGKVIELIMPVDSRDDVPSHLRRLPPSRLGYVYERKAPPSYDERNIRALKKLECELGQKELERQTGYSMSELETVWKKTPPPPGAEERMEVV